MLRLLLADLVSWFAALFNVKLPHGKGGENADGFIYIREYCIPLPDNLENADEEEIINYVQEYWTDLIDGNHDCWFGDITMID